MKKQLLFTLAMASGMVAFAGNPVVTQEAPEAVSQSEQVSLRETMLKTYDRANELSTKVDAPTITFAEGTDSMTAMYQLPGGAFYVGGMQEHWGTNLANPYLLIPNEVPLFWDSKCYKATDGAKWYTSEWTYEKQTINGTSVSLDDVTSDKDDLTTDPFYSLSTSSGPYYPPTPVFTINKAGDKGVLPSSYTACAAGMYTRNGRPTFSFGGDYGVQQMMLTDLYPKLSVGGFSNLKTAGANEYGMVYFTSIALGQTYFSDSDAKLTRIGFYLPAPSKTFGLSGISFRLVVDAFGAEKMSFDVYEAEPISGKVTYQIGKRIGGGYLNGSEIKPDAVSYVDVVIPVMDGEEESFVNIDKGVIVLVGGFVNDANTSVSWPMYVAPSTSPLAGMHLNAVAEFSEPLSYVRYITPGTTTNGVQIRGMQWCVQYLGQYSSLGADPDESFEMTVGAEGGEKEFVFEPYEDISTDGKFTGEGANDWVLFEVGDVDLIDYTQTVTVMVDPLPEGVSGRETTVYVEICGAKQAIKIKQGDVSAIDEVGSDAEVVATQYYDLQGRALKAAPEAGLYLKKEVRADGNVQTVKVAE